MNIDTRVFFMVIGRLFFRRLILPLTLFVITVSLLDPNINWTALREELSTFQPWQVTLIFTSMILCWSMVAGRALRPVWMQPTIAFLVRQPIGRWYWVRYMIPSLSIAFLPIVGIWWLAPHYAHPVAHYLGFIGLAWTIILGASFHGLESVKLMVLGTALMAALIFGYTHRGEVAYLALIITIVLLPMAISGIRAQLVQSRNIRPGHLTSRWPVATIVWRDLLCLWRMERKSLFGLILPAAIAILMMLALRVNTQVSGRDAFTFSCGLLSFAAIPTIEILSRLKTRLGAELIRQRWPVSHADRGLALLLTMAALTGPTIIALIVLASSMGLAYGLLYLLFAINTLVGLIALFSRTLIVASPMLGWGLWLLFLHVLLAVTLPAWAYAAIAIAIFPLGISAILKGLRMFTYQTEFGNLDQFA